MSNTAKTVSALTIQDIANYLRLSETTAEDNALLTTILEAAKAYVYKYTGLTAAFLGTVCRGYYSKGGKDASSLPPLVYFLWRYGLENSKLLTRPSIFLPCLQKGHSCDGGRQGKKPKIFIAFREKCAAHLHFCVSYDKMKLSRYKGAFSLCVTRSLQIFCAPRPLTTSSDRSTCLEIAVSFAAWSRADASPI